MLNNPIRLLPGESATLQLVLHNIGTVAVDRISVCLRERVLPYYDQYARITMATPC